VLAWQVVAVDSIVILFPAFFVLLMFQMSRSFVVVMPLAILFKLLPFSVDGTSAERRVQTAKRNIRINIQFLHVWIGEFDYPTDARPLAESYI